MTGTPSSERRWPLRFGVIPPKQAAGVLGKKLQEEMRDGAPAEFEQIGRTCLIGGYELGRRLLADLCRGAPTSQDVLAVEAMYLYALDPGCDYVSALHEAAVGRAATSRYDKAVAYLGAWGLGLAVAEASRSLVAG